LKYFTLVAPNDYWYIFQGLYTSTEIKRADEENSKRAHFPADNTKKPLNYNSNMAANSEGM